MRFLGGTETYSFKKQSSPANLPGRGSSERENYKQSLKRAGWWGFLLFGVVPENASEGRSKSRPSYPLK